MLNINENSRNSPVSCRPEISIRSFINLLFWFNKPLVSAYTSYPNRIFSSKTSTYYILHVQFSSIQSLSCVRLFATPWTAALQASLSITHSRSLLKLMSIESVMPSNHLILCCPLLLPPSIFPSIRVFSNESFLHIRCPQYWSFSFSISTSKEIPGLISFRMD